MIRTGFRASLVLVTVAAAAAPAQPTITGITPSSVQAGSGAFSLTVSGSSFSPTSSVNWNGAPLNTRFDNSKQLTASVPASLVSVVGAALITVTAKEGTSSALIFTITALAPPAADPPLAITTTTLPPGIVGTPYSQSLSATGGTPPYTWSIAAGALPPGLILNPQSGLIAGTPLSSGMFNFTVGVTDSSSATATASLGVTIAAALAVATTSLPAGSAGVVYSATLAATGGVAPYTWSLAAGALPPGLALNAQSGLIGGTPSGGGTFNFTVRVTDSASATATGSLALTIAAALAVATTDLPAGSAGVVYSATLAATGGVPPYTWSVAAGALPPGLTLNPAGSLGGTPSTTGSFTFSLQVTDSASATASRSFTIAIGTGLTIVTSSLPDGEATAPYTQTLTASGGPPPYSWRLVSGSLPAGLTLSSGGVISGTPAGAGVSSFSVEVSDVLLSTATRQLSLTIIPGVSITTASLANGGVGAPYSQTLAARDGAPPYTWAVSAGSLPPGVTLNSNGGVAGTPTQAGSFAFTAQVTDSRSSTASRAFTIAIAPGLSVSTTTLPGARVGVAYSQALSASGGTPPYTWSVASGSLPPGLSLSTGGTIAGTPGAAGNFAFTVQVTDSAQATASRALSIASVAALSISTASFPTAVAGVLYSQALAATGGSPPYRWSVAGGSLPPGISVDPGGALGGTPSAAGNFSFTIQVSDSASITATRTFALTVGPPVSILTTTLPNGVPGIAYSQVLTAAGGTPPYTWMLDAGSLPAGLDLNALSGAITGTPGATGSFAFTVQVSDSAGGKAQRLFTMTVGSTLTIATASPLPNASAGAVYSLTLAAAGGVAPYTWSLTQDSLPSGLTLAPSGAISGTPDKAGTFSFTVQVTDAARASVSQRLTLSVVTGLTITSVSPLPSGGLGADYTQALAAIGGTAPYTWSIAGGSLPPGLTLDPATGVISGTASRAGSFDATIQVRDAASARVSKPFTLAIVSGFTISTASALSPGAAGAAYSAALAAVGGTAPYRWSVTTGSLPPGLSLDASTGILSGTPAQSGNSQFTVQVSDAAANQASKSFTLAIAPQLTIAAPAFPPGTAGKMYSQKLSAAGGTPPYTWALASGSLPDGLALDASAGTVSGTPVTAGTFRFTARVNDSAQITATQPVTLAVGLDPLPAVNLDGLSANANPLEQPRLSLSLQQGYTLPVTGRLTLTFQPDAAAPADDPAVQFSTGGRTVTFNIPAQSTAAAFPVPQLALQTGSVSGLITLAATLEAGGVDATPAAAPVLTAKIGRSAPVIRGVKLVRTSSGFEVWITGFSPSRELTQAAFRFIPGAVSDLQTTETTVPLSDAAQRWYQDSVSSLFGSQFTLVQPFTIQGNANALASVTVTLSNAQGSSAPATATF